MESEQIEADFPHLSPRLHAPLASNTAHQSLVALEKLDLERQQRGEGTPQPSKGERRAARGVLGAFVR